MKKKVVPSSVILLSSLPQKGTCLWPPKGLMILVPLFCIFIDYSILIFHWFHMHWKKYVGIKLHIHNYVNNLDC